MNVDTTQKFNHISLCTGYGGIDLGLARVLPNLRTLAYCEIELYAIENLIDKMEKGIIAPAPIWSNLKTFPFDKFRGCVDLLSGGFPCQPFSSAGRRDGDTDPRHLFPFIKQGIIESRPAFVLLENVRGLISSKLQSDEWTDPKETPVLLHVLREMERIGYECHWGLFSARETGLPHLRQRVFILGKRTDIETSRLEEFSRYILDTGKGESYTCNRDRTCVCESKLEYDQGVHGANSTTFLLQKITTSAFSAERIQSSSICTPSGRDREQQFYEPPRTLRKNLGNTNKERRTRCEHDNADQGTCEHRSSGCEDFKTSSLRSNERTDQDLGNANGKHIEPVDLSSSDGHLEQETRREQAIRFRDASTHRDNDRATLADTGEKRYQRYNENAGNGRVSSEQTQCTRCVATTSPTIGHEQGFNELADTDKNRSRFLQENAGTDSRAIGQGQKDLVINASPTIRQTDIRRTTSDERTSTSETGIREDTGRDQPFELSGNVESEMGRNVDGASDWLDYEKLCTSYTSIVDEIALLGNGVVPATAELAFRILFSKFL